MTEAGKSVIIADTMAVKDVTDLRIYRQSMELLPLLYELSRQIPERDLRDQLQGAGRSIAPLIAEGFAKKPSTKEFKRFLTMALGSSDEVQTHLSQTSLIYKLGTEELIAQYKALSKQIHTTITVWS